jgi:hypothetical protein
MKNLFIFSLLICITFQATTYSSDTNRLNLSVDVNNNKDLLEPIEWFNKCYKKLDNGSKLEMCSIVSSIVSSATISLKTLTKLESELKSDKDLYPIAMEFISSTKFDAAISEQRKNNRPFLSAVAFFMRCITVIPENASHLKALETREDFIAAMPVFKEMIKNMASRSQECLQLIFTVNQ